MDDYITLHDHERAEKGLVIFIRYDHISAILPREKYTTLVVSGKYIHVKELVDEVLDRIHLKN